MLIGFCGVPGSGKTYSALKMISYYSSFGSGLTKLFSCSLSEKIKHITLELFSSWNYRHIRGDLKEIVDPKYDISPRKVQQIVGKSLMEISSTLWSDLLFESVDNKGVDYRNDNGVLVTVDDVRFPQDFDAIKSRNGTMIGIIPGKSYEELGEETMNYETEKHTSGLIEKCDFVLTNNFDEDHDKTLQQLAYKLWHGEK